MIEPRHLCAKKAPDENGAGERSRTPDRLITNQLLYQLSYASNNQTGLSYNSPIEAGRIVEKGCGGCNCGWAGTLHLSGLDSTEGRLITVSAYIVGIFAILVSIDCRLMHDIQRVAVHSTGTHYINIGNSRLR